MRQRSRLIKANRPNSRSLNSLLRISPIYPLGSQSDRAEGIGQVVEDGHGHGEAVGDQLEQLEEEHDALNVRPDHLCEKARVEEETDQ